MTGFDCIEPDWPAPGRVRALVTTRRGGTSEGPYAGMNLASHVGDSPAAVWRNRELLRSRLPAEPLWLEQVHGIQVADGGVAAGLPRADASVARQAGRVCAVLTADCLPVLLCDRAGTVVAAAHAGWRGMAAGVLEATLVRMETPPETLLAWLGPAIGPRSFEVGEDVRRAFVEADEQAEKAFAPGAAPGKWLADLFVLARQRLGRAGVRDVYGGGLCTMEDPSRFYSYRRDGVTGRFASLIWLAD